MHPLFSFPQENFNTLFPNTKLAPFWIVSKEQRLTILEFILSLLTADVIVFCASVLPKAFAQNEVLFVFSKATLFVLASPARPFSLMETFFPVNFKSVIPVFSKAYAPTSICSTLFPYTILFKYPVELKQLSGNLTSTFPLNSTAVSLSLLCKNDL